MAFKEFSDWIETKENQLNTLCHCCPPQTNNWKSVIENHQIIQNEVEQYGHHLNWELKQLLKKDKTITKEQRDYAAALEDRWKKLWLKSLEQLVVVENDTRCPAHNSTMIEKPIVKGTPNDKRLLLRRTKRTRPFSYPNNNERLEWDYQHTLYLTGCHKENGSHLDLDSVDEQETKKLTEFGENYEVWFGKEDEVASIPVHSRPPSVEPAEEPEIVKAIVSSNDNFNGDVNFNLLMLTTQPSVFSIDTTKYSNGKRTSRAHWIYIFSAIFVVIAFMITNIFQEPHQMHKSYQYSQPPV